jgi:hypothetical protein
VNVPNLDALGTTPGPLRLYAMKLSRRLRRMSGTREAIIGGVYNLLIHYARTKAGAMEDRLQGNIPSAMHLEGLCDRIYQQLPEKARW